MNPNAPSVDFPVGRFFMGVCLVFVLSGVTACAFAFSHVSGDLTGWRVNLLMFSWGIASCISFWAVRHGQQKCWLSWNGHVWQVLPLAAHDIALASWRDCAMTVHVDLQRHMLVSAFNHTGFRKWFWVSQQSFPDRWHGFRCAVYSRPESTLFH
ncbi:MAG: hypothetical protein RL706_510 [Pseudomonadota bacterium]